MYIFKTVFLFLLIAAVIPSDLGGQDLWVLYDNPIDGSFTVEVPTTMDVRSKEVKTTVGPLETIAFTIEGEKEDKIKLFLINQVDYPLETFPVDSVGLIDEFLLSSILSAAETIGGEIVYKSQINKLGNGAYLFRIKYNDGNGIVKGKILLHDDTLYMLQVYCHVDDSLFDEINYFLNSFKLKT